MFLASKVPIEPAVGEPCGRHYVGEARLGDPGAAQMICSSLNNGPARLCSFFVRFPQAGLRSPEIRSLDILDDIQHPFRCHL